MKYIRTKDGRICKVPNKTGIILYDNDKLLINTTKKGQTCIYGIVEKQADTIEELCDEFVAMIRVDDDRTFEMEDNFTQLMFVVKGAELEDFIGDIFGAIWTNKGLIYVAKMNDKGELELL